VDVGYRTGWAETGISDAAHEEDHEDDQGRSRKSAVQGPSRDREPTRPPSLVVPDGQQKRVEDEEQDEGRRGREPDRSEPALHAVYATLELNQ
jgi:hypothetical protein